MEGKTMTAEEVAKTIETIRWALNSLPDGDSSKAWDAASDLAAQAARVPGLEEMRDDALDLLRSARATLHHLGSSHAISEHAYQEFATYLDDEPLGEEGERITTRAESERDSLQERLTAVADERDDALAQRDAALELSRTAEAERDAARKVLADTADALACGPHDNVVTAARQVREGCAVSEREIATLRERVAALEQRVADQEREKAELRTSEGTAVERERQQHARAIEAVARVRELEGGLKLSARMVGSNSGYCWCVHRGLGETVTEHESRCSHLRGVLGDAASQPPPAPSEEPVKCKDCGVADGDGGHVVNPCHGCNLEVCGDCTDPTTPDAVRVCADCFEQGNYGQPPPAPAHDVKTREALSCIENALLAVGNGLVSSRLKASYAKDALTALRALFPGAEPISPALAGRGEPAPAQGVRHVTKENGDCPHWCEACRMEAQDRKHPTPPPGLEGTDDHCGQATAGTGRAQGEDDAQREGADVPEVQAQGSGEAAPARRVDCGASMPVVQVGGSGGDVTPPGLREAVTPLVPIMQEALRRYPAGMLALYSPASEVRRILAAYDATGGEDYPRPVANCGHVNDGDGLCTHPASPTPECHEHACPLLRKANPDAEDAAKYRAAVERATSPAFVSDVYREYDLNEASWADLATELLRPDGAPRETLDKARVVEVVQRIHTLCAEEDSSIGGRYVNRKWRQRIMDDLGLTLDTPPSGPGL